VGEWTSEKAPKLSLLFSEAVSQEFSRTPISNILACNVPECSCRPQGICRFLLQKIVTTVITFV
jgi:hypothetical protein